VKAPWNANKFYSILLYATLQETAVRGHDTVELSVSAALPAEAHNKRKPNTITPYCCCRGKDENAVL
jgi:hypothetical protein